MPRSIPLYLLCLTVLLAPTALFGAESVRVVFSKTIMTDDKNGMLRTPAGVACGDKSLIVADTGNGRLLRYTLQEEGLKGGTEIKVDQLVYPVRVQIDSKEGILVLDGKLRRIARLSPEGAFLGYLEPQGVPAPALAVKSFKLDSHDNIYLLDVFGERVVVLDPAGKFLRQLPLPQNKGFISDLAVNAIGDILLVDSINARVFTAAGDAAAFTPLTESMHDYMKFPLFVTTDGKGNIYLVDQNGGAIVTLKGDGTFQGRQLDLGWKQGLLYYPEQICLTKNDELVIADRNNSRVQLFKVTRISK
jgi:hypothetical protein